MFVMTSCGWIGNYFMWNWEVIQCAFQSESICLFKCRRTLTACTNITSHVFLDVFSPLRKSGPARRHLARFDLKVWVTVHCRGLCASLVFLLDSITHECAGLPIIFFFHSAANYCYLGYAKSCVKIWIAFHFRGQCTLLEQWIYD